MKRSTVVGLVIAAGVLLAGGWFGWTKYRAMQAGMAGGPPGGMAGFEPMEAVQVVEARDLAWQETADLVGTVFPIRAVTVRNELAAAVTFVGFDSGSVVEAGQVLLRQDDTTERADLAAAQAAIRVAEANVAQVQTQVRLAEVELERLAGAAKGAVAEVEVDRARAKVDAAKADLAKWQAEVEQAQAHAAQVNARLAKLTIHAPFRARAGMRTVHEGQMLPAGADVVTLQELTDSIYLDFAIPQQYAPRVAIGTKVMATGTLLGPNPVAIEVVAVDAVVNNQTRNLRVRGLVANPGGVLVPGMFVQVRVPIDAPKTFVAIPSTAVRRNAYATSVFVVPASPDAKGDVRVAQRFVTLGQSVGDEVIVLDGLRAGERVAAAGSFKLRDGAKVLLAPPGAAQRPNGQPGS
ncbi:MAG: acriflavin resistance protein [Phycisphaerae bacterium]|nr:MAG: acriflavin resistance protein [Phycisphaerae bacterium]